MGEKKRLQKGWAMVTAVIFPANNLWKLQTLSVIVPIWSFQTHDNINDRNQNMVEKPWIMSLDARVLDWAPAH